jgi:hypothetical protein
MDKTAEYLLTFLLVVLKDFELKRVIPIKLKDEIKKRLLISTKINLKDLTQRVFE